VKFGTIMNVILLSQGCTSPGRQVAVATKFLRWLIVFVGPQHGTCFMSLFWRVEFWGDY
jgi:hypothetical protein